ncbi:class I SAM-dependent methyltransferase [Pseudomonas sediminis]|uniref:Class I SAM-dependent methyltransferase n=1 Tax=Pseudomonas sediminis TaxID=1691904 RepID=A0ABX6SPM9_9PSED|nr:class I SAM-dependent methyltransferase [Pseudomonas sediminis]QNH03110.1 class I SAM-dependent methyltransferase [Pseudomonas sediminis]
MKCRGCGTPLNLSLVDLGTAPPSNAYLSAEQLDQAESWVPLRVLVCEACWLVQTEDYRAADTLFDPTYAYFSSYSSSWLEHAQRYVEAMIERFGLDADSRVIEVAANDGYLLQYVAAAGIPCLGVEPTASTAAAARARGLDIRECFFGASAADELREQGWAADLMVANNVLAHVPDINDFLQGFSRLLKATGVVTFEFPHLLKLMENHQFDTLYHEHYSYLSLSAVQVLCKRNGLAIFDVEELSTHGGSLRVFAQLESALRPASEAVARLLLHEQDAGVTRSDYYASLAPAAHRIKHDLLDFLVQCRKSGKRVAAYGAAAKGNTLLNYAGVRDDLLSWVADISPHKQGKFLPGSRIPVVSPSRIYEEQPDFLLVLPWNLQDEVTRQQAGIAAWGGRFVVAIPELRIL